MLLKSKDTAQMGLDDISNILSEEDCKEILLRLDENKKFVNYKISKYSDNVLGFLAEHYLLSINFSKPNEDNAIYSQKFFLKSLPLHNENQREYIKSMHVFEKEILLYKNLLTKFSTMVSKSMAPKYYYSISDQCLVIEDLSSRNYKVCDTEYLDFEKCRSALDTIATFHAASIIFEENRSTEEKPFRINEHFNRELSVETFSFQESHVRNMWCESATKCLGDLSRFFTDNGRVADKIKDYVFSQDGFRRHLKPSEKYRNVVCHDDLWRNNLMFNENNECILVDFQLSRYATPVFDVLLLLYLNVERNCLNNHFNSFLEKYYSCLESELSKNNIDIQKIIPTMDFLASIEEYTLPALVQSCLFGTTIYLSKEMTNRVMANVEAFEEFSFRNKSSLIIEEFETNCNFRQRFDNILKPFFEIFEAM